MSSTLHCRRLTSNYRRDQLHRQKIGHKGSRVKIQSEALVPIHKKRYLWENRCYFLKEQQPISILNYSFLALITNTEGSIWDFST